MEEGASGQRGRNGASGRGEGVELVATVGCVPPSYHALCVGVAEVRGVRRSVVDHGLVYRVGGLVREYAGGEAGHHLYITLALFQLSVHTKSEKMKKRKENSV